MYNFLIIQQLLIYSHIIITPNCFFYTEILLIRGLSPLPKCTSMNPRKRKAQSASILTSSPYKNQLIEQERKKEENGKGQLKTKYKQPRNKSIRKSKMKIILQIHNDSESDEEEWPCIVCGDTFAESTLGESWVQGQSIYYSYPHKLY